MALKKKTELKEVFADLVSVLVQETPIDLTAKTITLAPEYDLPVTIDTLTIQQGEPTINHYKVHGLTSDWVSTSTPGDFEISMTVPTLHSDVLKLAYGTSAINNYEVSFTGESSTAQSFKGIGVNMEQHKVECSLALLNSTKDKLLVINNAALWASPLYENGSTDPFAIRFTGTLETSEGADILYLAKDVENTESSWVDYNPGVTPGVFDPDADSNSNP